MNYLIIALVFAMVVSPIFWIMPSPRQKKLMQFRQRAMALGFQVKVCELPQTERERVRREEPKQGVMYLLSWQQKRKTEMYQHLLIRTEIDTATAERIWTPMEEKLRQALLELPVQVKAIECATPGVAIYWTEQGGIELLETIYQRLFSLRDELQALPMLSPDT